MEARKLKLDWWQLGAHCMTNFLMVSFNQGVDARKKVA